MRQVRKEISRRSALGCSSTGLAGMKAGFIRAITQISLCANPSPGKAILKGHNMNDTEKRLVLRAEFCGTLTEADVDALTALIADFAAARNLSGDEMYCGFEE